MQKPFSGESIEPHGYGFGVSDNVLGTPTHEIEVIGEPNRPAVVRRSNYSGSNKSNEKSGDVPAFVPPNLSPRDPAEGDLN